jgi:hypothetical protein
MVIDNKFIDGLTYKNTLLVKFLLVIFGLLVNFSVIKLPIDLVTTKARQKKFTRFILSVFSSGMFSYNHQKYHMSFHQ